MAPPFVAGALGVRCAMRTDDPILDRHVRKVFQGMTDVAPAGEPHSTDLEIVRADHGWDLRCNGTHRVNTRGRSGILTQAVHAVNRAVIDESPYLLVHAGVVARDGRSLVLPAAMESGKTTLVTGLVEAGYVYLSDEAAGFEWGSDIVRPFRKPLSLDQGSWHLFPHLEPPSELELSIDALPQWQIPADQVSEQPAVDRCPIRWVIFPQYQAGAETVLEPVTRAEAVMGLVATSFHFDRDPISALESLACVVESADCFRLRIGALAPAVRLIDGLTSA